MDLVERLSTTQRVEAGGPDPTAEDLRRRVQDLKYAFIRFPSTEGGTDLGMTVDEYATRTDGADFGAATGTVHIEGTLQLDFENLRCVADLDLATLSGEGRLVRA